jgi:hypothetical protein
MTQSIALPPKSQCGEGLIRTDQGIPGEREALLEKTGEKQAGSGLWPRKASPLEQEPGNSRRLPHPGIGIIESITSIISSIFTQIFIQRSYDSLAQTNTLLRDYG